MWPFGPLVFLGSLEMNRSAGQTNRVNREAVLEQGPFLKFSDKCYKFKIPTATAT